MIRSHLDPFRAKVVAVIATILIFGADWWTLPSINVSLFFGCVIVLLAWTGSLRWLWIYALTSAVLSFFALYAGSHTPIDTTNRYITVSMLAVIAGFVHFSIVLANKSLIEIAQREQAEESLRQSRSELAHVGRVTMMGELGSSIAHEITQPLSGIMMNSNASLRWLSADPPISRRPKKRSDG
jgi:signal transduction histidine kinase